jgi:hypothetical protein
VVDPIKEFLQIDVHHPFISRLGILLGLLHSVVGTASGSKPIAVRRELPLKDRREHLCDRLLEQTIHHRRYPQQPHSALRFGYLYPPHGTGLIGSAFERGPDLQPMLLQVRPQVFHRHPVDPRCACVALDSLQRCEQVLAFPYLFPQLYVGFSLVSRWGWLGALISPGKLHFPPLVRSPRILGFLPSSFIPQAAQSTHPFLMFGPSLCDGSGTMASADPCGLNRTSRSGLPLGLAAGLPR